MKTKTAKTKMSKPRCFARLKSHFMETNQSRFARLIRFFIQVTHQRTCGAITPYDKTAKISQKRNITIWAPYGKPTKPLKNDVLPYGKIGGKQ